MQLRDFFQVTIYVQSSDESYKFKFKAWRFFLQEPIHGSFSKWGLQETEVEPWDFSRESNPILTIQSYIGDFYYERKSPRSLLFSELFQNLVCGLRFVSEDWVEVGVRGLVCVDCRGKVSFVQNKKSINWISFRTSSFSQCQRFKKLHPQFSIIHHQKAPSRPLMASEALALDPEIRPPHPLGNY